MNYKLITAVLLAVLSIPAWSGDACLHGKAVNGDGSKINGTAKISTSWNGRTAYPRKGRYELCLGSNPGKTITVYVDGNRYTRIHVDGDTRLNIIRR